MASEIIGYTTQITVTSAGTAVQGPSTSGGTFAIKAHPDNTDTGWVGNVAGDVASTNGFPLNAKEGIVVKLPGGLSDLWFDTDVNNEKFCVIKLGA